MKKKIESLKIAGAIVPVKENKKFRLHLNDWLKALLIAVGAPVLEYFLSSIQTGSFEAINWNQALIIAASAAGMYLLKNFFSPTTVTIKSKDL